MNKKKFMVSALALSSLNSFAGEIQDIQKAAMDEVFQQSGKHYSCEYVRNSWWTGKPKSKTSMDLDLESKTLLAITRDAEDGTIISKKTFQLVIWKEEGSNLLHIKAKTPSTERPEVTLCYFDTGTKEMDLSLELLSGKIQDDSVQIQCK